MQAELTTSQRHFVSEVEAFLRENLPAEIAEAVRLGKGVSKAQLTRWTRILNARGWAAPNWPVEHGGTGWSLIERQLFDTACRLAHAPVLSGFGFNMVGPAIIKFGTAEQQAEHLPKILNAERWWCQGYSEPGAGSDLASLSTRAEDDGDHYRVTGRKIWTSGAELADWIFALVRTNPDVQPQRGITFLLIDLTTPGISIEPLYAFNGKRLWNQVVFDEVRVPKSNRLGEENKGWTVAKSLLGDERLLVSRVAENKRLLSIARDVLRAQDLGGDDYFERRTSELEVRLSALDATSGRILSAADAGGQIGAEPSMLKLKGSELVQTMDELLFEAVGLWAAPLDSDLRGDGLGPIGPDYAEYVASGTYHHRGYTIAGGSSEIQHNIIAKQVLGL